MSIPIQSPLPLYLNLLGEPMTGGSVWFGVPGLNPETDPVQVFWDEDLTQPAAQPVRTINGSPSRAGTPARLFTQGDFSQTVRDAEGRMVLYAATATNGPSAYGKYALSCSDLTSALVPQVDAMYFRLQSAFLVREVRISLLAPSSAGPVTLRLFANGAPLLGADLQIDAGQEYSTTSIVQPPILLPSLPDGCKISGNIVLGGTGARGLIFYLEGRVV